MVDTAEHHDHTKVYSDRLLLSNPPRLCWICSECGEKGDEPPTIQALSQHPTTMSYSQLVEKFKK
jgi:hypothetical protein